MANSGLGQSGNAGGRGEQDRAQTICLLILTFIASAVALYLLRPVLVPFVLALFFTYCLTPLIDFQVKRLGAPRGVAVVGAAVVGLALLVLAGVLITAAVAKMSNSFGSYQQQFDRLAERVTSALPRQLVETAPDGSATTLPATHWFKPTEQAVGDFLAAAFAETRDAVSTAGLVAIFMIFLLLGSKGPRARPVPLLLEIESRVQRYITQMILFSTGLGLLVAGVLALCGVQFAGLFGFLAFFLNFIPNVGGIIATLLPLPLILLSPDMSFVAKVTALAGPGIIQFVTGNIIQPRVQGSALDLHPVIVLMALIFFGMIWGIVGAFLAVPITATIRIVLEKIPDTRPVAELLAGRLDFASGENVASP
jgi:AI-2 transport protein TqsA